MKRMTLFIVVLCVLFVSSPAVQARYIVEHQQLHEIIGQHTLTDFIMTDFNESLEAQLPLVSFDEPLALEGVDRLSISITGTIGPITVCGDGVIRPDECYELDGAVGHDFNVFGLIPLGISDPTGTFSDDDPAFEQQWIYNDPGKPYFLITDLSDSITMVTNHNCGPDGVCYPDNPVPNPDNPFHPVIDTLQFVVGPLTEDLRDIPFLTDPLPCFPPDPCFVPLYSCVNDICMPPHFIGAARGLHVEGPVQLTITDAYITREWGIIPEPGSLAVLGLAAFVLMRRR